MALQLMKDARWRVPAHGSSTKDYLGTHASEAAVESVFSSVTYVLGLRRHYLKEHTVRMLKLLRNGFTC